MSDEEMNTPTYGPSGLLLDVLDLPELTTEWLADDIRKHIEEYHVGLHHGYYLNGMLPYRSSFTKASKANLIKVHAKLHEGDYYRSDERMRKQYFCIDHVHSELPAAPVDPDAPNVDLPLGTSPLLTRTEQLSLEKIVEGDFAALKAEIEQMAADALELALLHIEQEFAEVSANGDEFDTRLIQMTRRHADEVAQLKRTHDDEMAELLKEAGEIGLVQKGSVFVPRDRDAAVERAHAENKRDKDRALNTLERKRLGTKRTVLLTGLTGAAHLVLETIPDAKQLMMQAVADRAASQRAALAISAAQETAS